MSKKKEYNYDSTEGLINYFWILFFFVVLGYMMYASATNEADPCKDIETTELLIKI